MKRKALKLVALLLAVACALPLASCKAKEPAATDADTDNTNKEDAADMSYADIYEQAKKKYEGNENPVAIIVMEDRSVIAFEMYPDLAENTVRNFISLANSGFYDGIIFHRVIDGFMIQTGDPQGNGQGGPGYKIEGEFSNNGHKNDLSHTPGVVSMARQGNRFNPSLAYNTAGSQFFICVASPTYLDGDYAAFGKVIDGMDAVYAIAATATDTDDRPLADQVMAYVRVDTHGVTYEPPVTIAE